MIINNNIVKQNIHEGRAKLSACVCTCPVNLGQKFCLAIRFAKYVFSPSSYCAKYVFWVRISDPLHIVQLKIFGKNGGVGSTGAAPVHIVEHCNALVTIKQWWNVSHSGSCLQKIHFIPSRTLMNRTWQSKHYKAVGLNVVLQAIKRSSV